jgi:hypothetical protein
MGRTVSSVEGRIRHLYSLGKLEHNRPYRAKVLPGRPVPRRGVFLSAIRKAWTESGKLAEDVADELGWKRQHVYDLTSAYTQTLHPTRLLELGRVLGLPDAFLVTGWIITFTRGMLKMITPEVWDVASDAIRDYIVRNSECTKEQEHAH